MRRSLVLRILAIGVVVTSIAVGASAQEPSETHVEVDGVRVSGAAHFSSVEAPREPSFVLSNLTNETRTVELVALVSVAEGGSRALRLRGPRSIVLAPGASQTISVAFDGEALQFGSGLPYRRFALTVRVGAHTGDAISAVGYICRIPLH